MEQFGHKIDFDFIPRRLDDEEMWNLIAKENPTNKGLGRAQVFYKHYQSKEHSSVGYLFENKSGDHVMSVKGSFVLKNMIVRDQEPGQGSKINHTIEQKGSYLIILDTVDRSSPISFTPKLDIKRK